MRTTGLHIHWAFVLLRCLLVASHCCVLRLFFAESPPTLLHFGDFIHVPLYSHKAWTSAPLGPWCAAHSSAGGLHSNLPSFVTICSPRQTKCWPPIASCLPTAHMGSAAGLLSGLYFRRISFHNNNPAVHTRLGQTCLKASFLIISQEPPLIMYLVAPALLLINTYTGEEAGWHLIYVSELGSFQALRGLLLSQSGVFFAVTNISVRGALNLRQLQHVLCCVELHSESSRTRGRLKSEDQIVFTHIFMLLSCISAMFRNCISFKKFLQTRLPIPNLVD